MELPLSAHFKSYQNSMLNIFESLAGSLVSIHFFNFHPAPALLQYANDAHRQFAFTNSTTAFPTSAAMHRHSVAEGVIPIRMTQFN